MKALQEFYHMAEEQNIVVDHFALSKREALSIMDTDGSCFIALNPHKIAGEHDERNKLAHELGHCITGAFYNQYSNCDCRRKHENTADKWAIQQLIPLEELYDAISMGYTNLWELADYFGVSEDFVKKAVCFYVNGNVATEWYF